MKKSLPYLLLMILAGAIVLLFFTGKNNTERKPDERVTLRRQDKLPYGNWVAFHELETLFPGAQVLVSRKEPGYWDSVSLYDDNQLYLSFAENFSADENELRKLIAFAQNGNDVFIAARTISSATDKLLQANSSSMYYTPFTNGQDNKTRLILKTPPFRDTVYYQYPGISFYSHFSNVNENTTQILGLNENNQTNFIRLRAGKGNFFVHLEPLAFTNYFLLHNYNIGYYEKAMSLIRPGITRVIWDEYYLNKPDENKPENTKGWMRTLMDMQNEAGDHPFRSAFWLLMVLGLIYVLLEMRRRQRLIPLLPKIKNESLDFVRTIGRLYFEKSDHRNLCRKMAAYFLEHVRTRYKLPTGMLNDAFIQGLHYKSGAAVHQIREIVSFISYLDEGQKITRQHLVRFHQQLESFYKNT